jgi:uncharacterized membrane protein YjjP (DUF1212 family)
MNSDQTTSDTGELLEFMFRLAQAYLACGEQTAKVELLLRRTATASGIRRSRVVVFPTAVFISLHEGANERVTLAEGPTETLRLDQIADVYELGEAAQQGTVTPREGLDRLNEIRRKSARFGMIGVVVGHTILTVGLAIVLMPTLTNLAAAAVLDTIVGTVKALNRDRPVLAVPLPVVAATWCQRSSFSRSNGDCRWTHCTRWCRLWCRSCPARCSRWAWWSSPTATWSADRAG